MLYVFGFERVAVVVGDLYFVDPAPSPGQEGPEHGVRLELRVLGRDVSGSGVDERSIYAAVPIGIGEPLWRVDLLQAVDGLPFDRTHHHTAFTDWDPGDRAFDRELSADPLGWLDGRLRDLDGVLASGGHPAAADGDAVELRRVAPEIVDVTRRLLERVRAGELGTPPESAVPHPDRPVVVGGAQVLVRSGWL